MQVKNLSSKEYTLFSQKGGQGEVKKAQYRAFTLHTFKRPQSSDKKRNRDYFAEVIAWVERKDDGSITVQERKRFRIRSNRQWDGCWMVIATEDNINW